jgi:hypothetical protein
MSEQSGDDRVRQAHQTISSVIGRCEDDELEDRIRRLDERLTRVEQLAAARRGRETPPKPSAEA